ncbi:disease resistance protein, partial [Trifolium medium]|nr:disease resistance protein [Trifolium medium]
WVAFKTKKVGSIDDDIVNRAIIYASGLPLAIDVIGSNLSGNPIAEWKSMLDQYKRIPPKDMQNILKVSFDDLDEESKNVFLDIACFFKGCRLEEFEAVVIGLYYGFLSTLSSTRHCSVQEIRAAEDPEFERHKIRKCNRGKGVCAPISAIKGN